MEEENKFKKCPECGGNLFKSENSGVGPAGMGIRPTPLTLEEYQCEHKECSFIISKEVNC